MHPGQRGPAGTTEHDDRAIATASQTGPLRRRKLGLFLGGKQLDPREGEAFPRHWDLQAALLE